CAWILPHRNRSADRASGGDAPLRLRSRPSSSSATRRRAPRRKPCLFSAQCAGRKSMHFTSMTIRRLISLTLVGCLTLQAVLFVSGYLYAVRYIQTHDLRQSSGVAGTLVFAKPRIYRRGQALRREELIAHLTGIGYQPSESAAAGTYALAGTTLRITARFRE